MDPYWLIVLPGCLALSFLFAGLKSAILSIGPARLRHAAKEGNRRARIVEKMLGRREFLLGSLLLVNASVNLIAFALITNEMVRCFDGWGYLIAALLSLPVYVIGVELLPKAVFKRTPLRLLCFFVPVLVLIDVTIRPLIQILSLPGLRLARRLSGAEPGVPPGATRAEFRAFTEILEREGTLPTRETRMIRGVLDFQQLRVIEVMRPLSRIIAVPQEMPVAAVIALARQKEIDQFPLLSPGGDLVGIVDVAELLRDRSLEGPARLYQHKLIRSEADESAIAVIRRLRRAGHQIAAVYHPAGHPIGMVSVSEMVRRLTQAAEI